MPLGEAIVGGAASLAGGWFANAQQLAESKRAREWSAEMAGSAYQRAVIDLKAAGLNPMLAYMQGGAQTPGAATAGSMRDIATPAVSSAREGLRVRKELELLQSQIDKTNAEAMSAGAKSQVDFRASQWDARRYEYYFDEQGRPRDTFAKLLEAEYGSSLASSARSISEAELSALSVPERKAIADLFNRAGSAGKGIQLILPLLQTLIGRR